MRNRLFVRGLILGCFAVGAAGITIRASGLLQQAPSTPDVVTLEFRAFAADGKPVLDLQSDDVTLKVDGRPRDLQSLALIQLPGRGRRADADIPAPFVTNAASDGRNVLMLVDDESISPGAEGPVRKAMAELLTNLSPVDRVALRTTRGGIGLWLTGRQERVLDALNGTVGRAASNESDADAVCRTKINLDAIRAAIGDLTRQTHPVLVYLAGKLTSPAREGGSTRMSTPAGLCELRWQDMEEIGSAVAASGVDLRVVQVLENQVTGTAQVSDQVAGLETLAGVSGRPLVRLTGNTTGVFARLAAEGSAYYVAAFAPEPNERNGGTHKVDLAVTRAGVKATTAPRVTIAKPGRTWTKNPNDLMQLGAVYRDVALRTAGFASRGPDAGKLNVIVVFEPSERSVKLASAVVALFNENGQAVAKATLQGNQLTSVPAACALPASPGSYMLRVAALDTSGRAGIVDHELRVELTPADPVALSDLVLGAADGGSFAPRLEFSNEKAAVGHFEVYGGGQVTAAFELTETPDGPALATFPAQISEGGKDVRRVYGAIPLSPVASGQALVRAVVKVDGKPVGRLLATLSKVAG